MRSAVLLLTLLALGESLMVSNKKPKRELNEESHTSAKDLARIQEDKTGGNEICQARMRIFGKKMDFKKIRAAKSAWMCQNDPSDAKSADELSLPKPSKDKLDLAGIIYITLGGQRQKWIEKVLKKHAKNITLIKHEATTPVKDVKSMAEFSSGKDAGYLNQQYGESTVRATRAVFMSHMKAIDSITELAKQTAESKNENVTSNKPWLIMEDDSELHKDWKEKMTEVLRSTPADWDMIKVGYWSERRCADKLNEKVYVPSDPTASAGGLFYQGNQGYLVRPESVEKILKAMKKQDVGDVDGNFVHAACRNAKGRNGGSAKHCYNLYAASEEYMSIDHNNRGSQRSMLAKVEPNLEKPWKGASGPEEYPFTGVSRE